MPNSPSFAKKQIEAVKQYTSVLFSSPELIGLLMDLNVPKGGFRHVSEFMTRRGATYTAATGLPVPCPIPSREVWRAFNKLILPHSNKEFIKESLWAKLKVGDRLKSWLPGQRHCCLCGKIKRVPHALFNCKFLLLAGDTISKCLSTPVHPISHDHLQTLSTPQ